MKEKNFAYGNLQVPANLDQADCGVLLILAMREVHYLMGSIKGISLDDACSHTMMFGRYEDETAVLVTGYENLTELRFEVQHEGTAVRTRMIGGSDTTYEDAIRNTLLATKLKRATSKKYVGALKAFDLKANYSRWLKQVKHDATDSQRYGQ